MAISALQPALSQLSIDRHMLDRMGDELTRGRGVVPLLVNGDELIVAMAAPADSATVREVQTKTGFRVTPRIATRREIDDALAPAEGGRLHERLEAPLRRLLLELWLRPDLVEERADGQRSVFENVVRSGFLASTKDGAEPVAEALSLLLYVPRVHLDRFTLQPWWSFVVPLETMVQYRVVPFLKVDSVLFVASPDLHGGDTWRELERLTGYDIQPVLCTLDSWEAVAGNLDGFAQPTPIQAQQRDDVVNVASQDRELVAMADRIAVNSRESRDSVLNRLSSDRLRQQAVGVATERADEGLIERFLEAGRDRPLPEVVLRRLPRQMAECLGLVPFATLTGQIRIATPRRELALYLDAAETLLESPVQVTPCSVTEFEVLLERVYPPNRRRYGQATGDEPFSTNWNGALGRMDLGDFLVRAAYLNRDRLDEARIVAERSGEFLGQVLISTGALTERDFLEAAGLKYGIPYVDAHAVHPARDTVHTIDRQAAEQFGCMPIWFDDPLLAVAVARPFDALLVNEIERVSGRIVRPVLTTTRSLSDAVTRLYADDRVIDWSRLREFGQYLVKKRTVTQDGLQGIYQRVEAGLSPDLAMIEAGIPAPVAARTMADFLGVPSIALLLTETIEQIFDPLGNQVSRITKHDPVNGNVARLLSRATSESIPALAYERRRDAIVVVVADPFEADVTGRLEAELGQRVTLALGVRSQINDAVRRTIGRKSIGDYLLEDGLITPEQLDRSLELSRNTGVRVGKAMLSLGIVGQDELVEYLANQHQLPLFDMAGMPVDEDVARILPEELERTNGFIPIAIDDQRITLATVDVLDPLLIKDIEATTNRKVDAILVTESDLDAAMEQVYRFDYLDRSKNELLYRSPQDSASKVLSDGQKIFFIGLLIVMAIFALINYVLLLQIVIGLTTIFYTAFSAYKFYLIYKALAHTLEVPITDEDVAELIERDLPVYTVLVPMYKEPEVLPILVRAIDRMDYPKTKLEVLLLLEEDDKETIETARAQRLPSHFQIIVVPDGLPKGKPKACNYGLLHSRGEYCVIFDAEDLPDPDQLKKALIGFRKGGANIACIQAKLNYFNRDQNLLTRWFTTEYSMWFDLFLPGLDASNSPIPLGGTSNHFRTAMLKELGGWDPYNVTEDADLGMRLFKLGWKTAVIDSTTYEEANSAIYNWIRQRSRWVKGYIITWLVHMRNPVALWKALGPYGFFSFQMVILGTFFGFLANPIFWFLTALWFLTKWGLIQQLFPSVIFYMGSIGLYFGNFAFVYMNVAGCLRREYYDMVKYALLSPAYWALMSIAAWKGLLQLFYAPAYWEKTQHGLYKGEISIAPANKLKDLL